MDRDLGYAPSLHRLAPSVKDSASSSSGGLLGHPQILYAGQSFFPIQSSYTANIPYRPNDMSIVSVPPQPAHILKSQDSPSPSQCAVCARFDCGLVSHKHYAEGMKIRAKSKHVMPSTPITPSRPKMPVHLFGQPTISAIQSPPPMDAERKSLLGMLSQPYGRDKKRRQRHLHPHKLVDRVLPIALQHAPLHQSVLATSAVFCSLANGELDDVAIRNRDLAAQMLAEACPDETTASTDECILAAVHLVLMNWLEGKYGEGDRRMTDVNHLVTARGGPHYLGLSGLVAESLLYADYLRSILFDLGPTWQLPLPALDVGVTTLLGIGFDQVLDAGELDMRVVEAARSVCMLTELFGHAPESQTSSGAINASGYLSPISEYQLARCNALFHGTSGKNECVCLALILFNHVVLRNYGFLDPAAVKIEQQLWAAFGYSETTDCWSSGNPETLLWVLYTGMTLETQSRCRWRVRALQGIRRVQLQLRLKDWDDARQVLSRFCWLPQAQEETFRSLWNEVLISTG